MELDLASLLADDALTLTSVPSRDFPEGKTYRVPWLSGGDVLLLRQMQADQMDAAINAFSEAKGKDVGLEHMLRTISPKVIDSLTKFCGVNEDGTPRTVDEKILGPVFGEMVADGVSQRAIEIARDVARTAFAQGEEVARMEVEQRAKGQARLNRAQRRAAAKATAPVKAAARAASPKSKRTGSGGANTRTGQASGRTPARQATRKATPATGRSSTSPTRQAGSAAKKAPAKKTASRGG